MKAISFNKDEDLLLRIRTGDEVAFELVFYKYKGKLYDFVRRSLPPSDDAESIVQDIFVKLWSKRNELDPSKSLNAFLYTIAKNEIYGHLRKLLVRRKYLEEFSYLLNDDSAATDQPIEFDELKRSVNELIDTMPEKRREIFLLSRHEGLSYKEIAKRLGISENTVDSQIRNALAYLKQNLKKKFSLFLLIFQRKHIKY